MRICLYTETALPRIGGQEMVVDALARQFRAAGHDARVFCPRPRGMKINDGTHPYPVLRHMAFYSTRRFLGWYAKGLIGLYERWPFDVLHCHSVYPTAYLASLSRSRLPVPLVVTSHGGDVREGNVRMRKPGVRERHAQGVTSADALIAISRFTRAGYERLAPEAGPIFDIPNGVDTATFAEPVPRPEAIPPQLATGNYLLCLGRMHPQKGGDVLLQAFAQAKQRAARQSDARGETGGDLANLRLVFAGSGPMRNEWEAIARREGVSTATSFLGFVAGETRTWLLQNALATVVPTRSWEAFGLAVVESFAAGRPVIASNLPGLADLISPEETGLLFPAGSVNSLATAITRLAVDPQCADAWGATARETAQQYDWSKIAGEHLKLYAGLLSSGLTVAA